MQVAVNELKAALAQFLAQAQTGEVIEVTSHRRPIARIVGIPEGETQGIGRLLAEGSLAWNGGKPKFEDAIQLSEGGRTVGSIVLEDRT
ncbi:MAG: type II toxin-antitoxin system prevent-host-death family antitoxin [Phenylobacterium sp.]|nr:type II toxin-antitoxin system prevent-host-death family antitoxin [Phenylobacterium sp.]